MRRRLLIFRGSSNSANDESSMLPKSLVLFFIGFFMILAGIIILVVAAVLSGSADFGAVIFIGPFPVVVGTGPSAEWMVLFAVIISILSIVVFFLLRREARRIKSSV